MKQVTLDKLINEQIGSDLILKNVKKDKLDSITSVEFVDIKNKRNSIILEVSSYRSWYGDVALYYFHLKRKDKKIFSVQGFKLKELTTNFLTILNFQR